MTRLSRLLANARNEMGEAVYQEFLRDLAGGVATPRASWYCDQCHVEVCRIRCQHCGKTEREPS